MKPKTRKELANVLGRELGLVIDPETLYLSTHPASCWHCGHTSGCIRFNAENASEPTGEGIYRAKTWHTYCRDRVACARRREETTGTLLATVILPDEEK